MHAYPYAAASLALITQWAVGVAATSAIADTEDGLFRDHPTYGRRLCTLVVPPMVITGLLAPFIIDGHFLPAVPPTWIIASCLVMLPFAYLSYRWSRAWLFRTPALRRRKLGVLAGASGAAGLIISGQLAVASFHPPWTPSFPMMLFLGTAALLGSLTTFTLLALTAGLPAEVPGGPARHISEVAGFGLAATLMAGLDIGWNLVSASTAWPQSAVTLGRIWLLAALVVPGLLLLSRLLRYHLPDSVLMTVALVFALVGQFAGLVLIFRFPGLVPPMLGY